MTKIYFKYLEHPGDFFRSTNVVELPSPQHDTENFLIQFLPNYHSDQRVALINDLYKLLDDEFVDENELIELTNDFGNLSKDEIKSIIKDKENELTDSAFENFYYLILEDKIKIIKDDGA